MLLAVPFFSLRLGVADSGNDPTKFTTRRAYDLLSQGFGPGFNGPLLVTGDATASDLPTREQVAGGDRRRPRRAEHEPGDPEPERQGCADPGRAEGLAAGREHDPARAPAPRRRDSRRDDRDRSPAVRGEPDRDRRRPRRHAGPAAPVHVRRDPALELHAADGRVPIAARAAQGRDHEPAVDRRGVRRDRRHLPVGLGEELRRHRQGGPDRGVGPDDAVRDRVRSLDGLRGVPPQPHQGGVRPDRQQLGGGRARPRQDRPADHRRGRDHDLRVRQLRALRPAGAEAGRVRARVRGVHRRDARPARARARDDGAARRPQLVAAEVARMAAARATSRASPTSSARRRRAEAEREPALHS